MRKILFLLFFVAGSVLADAPVKRYFVQGYEAQGYGSTPQTGCDASFSYIKQSTGTNYSSVAANGESQCMYYLNGSLWNTKPLTYRMLCANGSTPDTTKALADQCAPLPPRTDDPDCPAGMHKAQIGVYDQSNQPVYACFHDVAPQSVTGNIPEGQCSYRNPTTGACETACPNGSLYRQVPTGAFACVKSDNSPPSTNAPSDCPNGYMNISATTTPNCTVIPTTTQGLPTPTPGTEKPKVPPTPSSSTTTTTPKTTTTNADGSTTETSKTTVNNRDGSQTTTTTTTTTKADGTKTTSTSSATGTTASGSQGVSDTQPNDQTDLCMRHPELNVCKNSAVTQADCSATVCTGDAIQCAILRKQMADSCSRKTDLDAARADAAQSLGDKALAGADPLASSFPGVDKASSVVMPSSLDSSGWLGGGACFPDKTFSVQGHDISISFTSACQPLIAFRYALMVVALLISFRMISGVIFRE